MARNGKHRNKQNNKESNVSEEHGKGSCTHVNKAIDNSLSRTIKKNNKSTCEICTKEKSTPNQQTSGPWICTKCGAKTCSRAHGQKHYEVSRTGIHPLVIDISTNTVWCYECKAQVAPKSKKKLEACISELSRLNISQVDEVPSNNENKVKVSQQNNFKKLPSKDNSDAPNIVGLINEGNTCYANSVLQCLSRTPKLEEAIQNDFETPVRITLNDGSTLKYDISESDRSVLIQEYLRVHGIISKNCDNVKVATPVSILRELAKKHPHFKWDEQHDAHEFLRMLLDSLRTIVHQAFKTMIMKDKNVLTSPQKKNATPELIKELKEIDQKLCEVKNFGPENVFGGQLVSRLQCKQCGFCSESNEKFMDLSLPVITVDVSLKNEYTPHRNKRTHQSNRKLRKSRDLVNDKEENVSEENTNQDENLSKTIEIISSCNEITQTSDTEKEENPEVDASLKNEYTSLRHKQNHQLNRKLRKLPDLVNDKKENVSEKNTNQDENLNKTIDIFSPCNEIAQTFDTEKEENQENLSPDIINRMDKGYDKNVDKYETGILSDDKLSTRFYDSGINDSDRDGNRSESESEISEISRLISSSDEHVEGLGFLKNQDDKEKNNYTNNSLPSEKVETKDDFVKADSADSALHETSVSSEMVTSEGENQKDDESVKKHLDIDYTYNVDLMDNITKTIVECLKFIPTKPSIPESCETEITPTSPHCWMNWSPDKHRDVSAWINNSEWLVKEEQCCPINPPVYCNNKRCPSSDTYGHSLALDKDGKPLISSMIFGKSHDVIELTNTNIENCKAYEDVIKQRVDDYFEVLPDGSNAGSKKLNQSLNYFEADMEARYNPESCRKNYPPAIIDLEESCMPPQHNYDLHHFPQNPCNEREFWEDPENKDCLEVVGEKTTFGETLETMSNGRESDDGLCISSLYDNEFTEEEMKITKVENENYDSSLENCLQEFIREELLTGSNKVGCKACTEKANKGDPEGKTVYTTFSKQLLIKTAPNVIILHLKRFQVQMSSVRKVNQLVSFPIILNMAPYCVQSKDNESKEDLFHLFGVVKHTGSINGGHYEAYVAHFKNGFKVDGGGETSLPEAQWYLANDRYVSPVSVKQVLSTQAYLLFYRRIES